MSLPLPDAALDQLFRTARTYNGYLDTPVERDQLEAIWDIQFSGPKAGTGSGSADFKHFGNVVLEQRFDPVLERRGG